MIGYFIYAGDTRVGHTFRHYINVISKIIKNRIRCDSYGTGLEIILIAYHIQGQFLELPNERIHARRYSKKEKGITVVVGVSRYFDIWSDEEKKKFIADTTLESIELVEKKYKKKDYFKIKFDKLKKDLQACIMEFQNAEIEQ